MPTTEQLTFSLYRIASWDWKQRVFRESVIPDENLFWSDPSLPRYYAGGAWRFEMLQRLANLEFRQSNVYTEFDTQNLSGPTGFLEVNGILVAAQFEFFAVSPASDWTAGDPNQARFGSIAFCDADRFYEPRQFVDFPKQFVRPQDLFPAKGISWYFRQGNAGTIKLFYIGEDTTEGMRVGHRYEDQTDWNYYSHYDDDELVDFPTVYSTTGGDFPPTF